MFLRNLTNQFLHDLKANWQKSVLLGVLFVIGLFFWVPPVYRALAGRKPTPTVVKTPPTAHQPVAAGRTPVALAQQTAHASSSASEKSHRSDTGPMRRADRLVQSVAPSAIRKDPFHVDPDQFPPPVVFAKEPKVEKPKQAVSDAAPPHLPEGLVLRSTILGANRRAAFINRRLYFPGMDVRFDGAVYKLIAVHPRRVVLRRGSVDFDLMIRKRDSSKNAGRQRSFVQPAGESTPIRRPSL